MMLEVSSFTESRSTRISFSLRFEVEITGSWAWLQRDTRTMNSITGILPKSHNSNEFTLKIGKFGRFTSVKLSYSVNSRKWGCYEYVTQAVEHEEHNVVSFVVLRVRCAPLNPLYKCKMVINFISKLHIYEKNLPVTDCRNSCDPSLCTEYREGQCHFFRY